MSSLDGFGAALEASLETTDDETTPLGTTTSTTASLETTDLERLLVVTSPPGGCIHLSSKTILNADTCLLYIYINQNYRTFTSILLINIVLFAEFP